MMMIRFPLIPRICLIVVWLTGLVLKEATSFSSLSVNTNFFPSPIEREQSSIIAEPFILKIRSTKESDVCQGISDMWANALVDPKQELGSPSTFNFRRRMYFLRSKASIEDLLCSRLKVIRAAEKTMEECSLYYDEHKLSEAERLRYLWSNERFRNTMERAAKLSNEPHRWSSHNFSCAPKNAEYLQHKMLTAENKITGEIVGFCEVAMLLDPSSHFGERQGEVHPTIVNLVVSPNHRRRGVASRIINSARNYVAREWDAEDLNLYVEKDNHAAVTLYQRLGFQMTSEAQLPGQEVHWYMSQPARSRARSKDRRVSPPTLQLVN